MDGKNAIFDPMKTRVNLLIAFGILVLLSLTVVQYYLVSTAYEYKVAEFRAEIKDRISELTDDFANIDRELVMRKDSLYKDMADGYTTDKQARMMIRQRLIENNYRDEITAKLLKEFQTKMPEYKIDFAVVLNKFVIYDDLLPADTIYAEKAAIDNKIYGNLTSLENAFPIRSYLRSGSGATDEQQIKYLTEDSLYVSVHNSEMIIFKRMALILAFAVFSILTLVTLFVIAVRALIRQKKISDIKTDFINNITHEFKTPLTTLAVSTKILQRPDILGNPTVMTEIVDTISRQNNRLHQLLDQVVLNSVGSEFIELNQEKVNINHLLQDIIADFQHFEQHIHIQFDKSDEDMLISLDKFHLTTALLNVLQNAVKYGCRNIIVACRRMDDMAFISVQDDGPGIKSANLPLLFDKFYRVREGNLHTTKGLGLGLYYVEQILRAHQGSVRVQSQPGKGAEFTLCLPV